MSNKTNLNQVVDAKSVVTLLNKNPEKLTTILFTDTKKQEGQLIKKKFIKLSKEFADQPCFFILIDKGRFNNPDNSINIDYNETTYFLIFFNGQKISSVNGPDVNVCKLNITKILEKMNEAQNNTEQDDDDDDTDDEEPVQPKKKENKNLSQQEIMKMKQAIQFKRMQKMMMLRRLKMIEKNQINMQMNLINQLERLAQSKKKMENDSDSD